MCQVLDFDSLLTQWFPSCIPISSFSLSAITELSRLKVVLVIIWTVIKKQCSPKIKTVLNIRTDVIYSRQFFPKFMWRHVKMVASFFKIQWGHIYCLLKNTSVKLISKAPCVITAHACVNETSLSTECWLILTTESHYLQPGSWCDFLLACRLKFFTISLNGLICLFILLQY